MVKKKKTQLTNSNNIYQLLVEYNERTRKYKGPGSFIIVGKRLGTELEKLKIQKNYE